MIRQAGRAWRHTRGQAGAPEAFGDRARRPVAKSRTPWTDDIVIAAERANWNACPLRPIGPCPLRLVKFQTTNIL